MPTPGTTVSDQSKFGVVVSGMQLLSLRNAIRQHHPPQRAVLSQICCFGERKVVLFQILLDGAEHTDARMTE